MTPLDRLTQIVNHINGPVGDEDRVIILIECADALIDVAREARAVAKYATQSLVDLDDALTALDSAILKALGETE